MNDIWQVCSKHLLGRSLNISSIIEYETIRTLRCQLGILVFLYPCVSIPSILPVLASESIHIYSVRALPTYLLWNFAGAKFPTSSATFKTHHSIDEVRMISMATIYRNVSP